MLYLGSIPAGMFMSETTHSKYIVYSSNNRQDFILWNPSLAESKDAETFAATTAKAVANPYTYPCTLSANSSYCVMLASPTLGKLHPTASESVIFFEILTSHFCSAGGGYSAAYPSGGRNPRELYTIPSGYVLQHVRKHYGPVLS
jgi:hypothetical protein